MPRNDEDGVLVLRREIYTYLTGSRLDQVEAASGVRFRWPRVLDVIHFAYLCFDSPCVVR